MRRPPVIDASVVTDFSKAIGAVERNACNILRDMARRVPADQAIVEIGAFKGRTTGYLALGAQEGDGAEVHTVDPWDDRKRESWPGNYEDSHVLDSYSDPSTYEAFVAHMEACGAGRVVHRSLGADEGGRWSGPQVGLLWHDGPHDYTSVKDDLRAWRGHVAVGGHIVLHDAANRSFGVYAAAHDALRGYGYNWNSRVLIPWGKNPEKRGILIVRRTV